MNPKDIIEIATKLGEPICELIKKFVIALGKDEEFFKGLTEVRKKNLCSYVEAGYTREEAFKLALNWKMNLFEAFNKSNSK